MLKWGENEKREIQEQVNIIDTIGFCDTELSVQQVHSMIKSSVRVNLAYIDKVVIVTYSYKQQMFVLNSQHDWIGVDDVGNVS